MPKKNVKSAAFQTKVDTVELESWIKEGKSASELLELTGLKSKQSLRQHVMRLCTMKQTFLDVPGLYAESSTRLPMVSQKHEVRLTKAMLDGKFSYGDKFNVAIDEQKRRITLTLIGANEASDDSVMQEAGIE